MASPRNSSGRSSYRPDVDGLRAVAVLLVLADHFGIRLRGGYVGVDIFFVISGYLISGIILSELANDKFSIVRFYERRVRRIFPALLVLIIVVTILVYRFFVPSEAAAYGRSMLATLFSVSNFLFWHQAGYFDEANFIKPLLHTWSLAVEEQFYIFFPLFLIAIRRYFPKRMKVAIISVAIISLVAAVLTVQKDSTAAFFFAPLRAWELMLGAMVSQHYLPSIRGAVARNVASGCGFLLIFASAFFYTSATAFPGLAAVPPCLGTALIIEAGETGPSLVGWILSLRPVVFVGLISYSVYLWHWPILVFERTSSIVHADLDALSTKFVLVAISLVVGYISWALVEQPFRQGRFRPGRRAVFAVNGAVAAVMVLVSFAFMASHGFPGRFSPDAQKVAAFTDYYRPDVYREGTCFLNPQNSFADFRKDICLPVRPGRRSILLAGDSHAAQLWPGFSSVFAEDNVMQANVSGCHPVITSVIQKTPLCNTLNSFLFDDYLLHNHVDVLVLSARWNPSDMEDLTRTIEFARLHDIFVVLIGPSIEYDIPLPRMLAVGLRDGRSVNVEQHLVVGLEAVDATMASLAQTQWHIPYISVFKDLCAPQCPVYAAPDVPLLFDADHMTADGSILLAKAVRAHNELPEPVH